MSGKKVILSSVLKTENGKGWMEIIFFAVNEKK